MRVKRIILFFVAISIILFYVACTNNSSETSNFIDENTDSDYIEVVLPGEECLFSIYCDTLESNKIENSHLLISEAIKSILNIDIPVVSNTEGSISNFIYIGNTSNDYYSDNIDNYLEKDYYEITVLPNDNGSHDVYIEYNGKFAMLCAIDRFIKSFIKPEGIIIPKDLYITGECKEEDALILSNISTLRDPCILVTEDGTYYAYGTGWVYYKNTSGSLDGVWSGPYDCVIDPDTVDKKDSNKWAPEVHFYNGSYYMFTTYRSTTNNHRGCSIFKSDAPEGPFVEITPNHFTPTDWDSIDATFYIDKEGDPWSVFVHEWTSMADGIGRMVAVRLTPDLTGTIGDPIELFAATDPEWATNGVTDGCWMYTSKDGSLKMIWSNWDSHGYCVGISESSDGTLLGTWEHDMRLLFSKTGIGDYDGGHGIIFYDVDGQMYLSVHSPNSTTGNRYAMPVFMPIREDYGTLVPDIWKE